MILPALVALAPLLECSLQAAGSWQPGRAPIRFTLRNAGDRPVWVLTWHTPLEGLLSRALRVTQDGREVAFEGPLVKRGDPDAEEYVRLGPGETAEEVVDLAVAYDVGRTGTYQIAFPGPLLDVTDGKVPRPRSRHRARPLSCGPIRVDLGP